GKLSEVVVIDVILLLIVGRSEKRVAEASELLRIEQREVCSECTGLIEDHRRRALRVRVSADEIHNAGNRTAAVECSRGTLDDLDLFQIERRDVENAQTAREPAERGKSVF